MLNNLQNTNFKSNIILSSSVYRSKPLDFFNVYAKNTCYVGKPWTMSESKILKEGVSDLADVCTIGFLKIKGAQEGYLFHSIPSNNFDIVKNYIKLTIDTFMKKSSLKNPQIEGILTGGAISSERSVNQYNKIMNLFDDLKISYSAILGRKSSEGVMNMYTSVPQDEYVLEHLGKNIKDQGSKEKNIEKLNEYFEIVKIRPEDDITLEKNDDFENSPVFQALRRFYSKAQTS